MAHEILIVDDEDDIRQLIAGILEDEGYESRQAANSADAFSAIAARQPSLIILDVWLRDSELLLHVRDRRINDIYYLRLRCSF